MVGEHGKFFRGLGDQHAATRIDHWPACFRQFADHALCDSFIQTRRRDITRVATQFLEESGVDFG